LQRTFLPALASLTRKSRPQSSQVTSMLMVSHSERVKDGMMLDILPNCPDSDN
jgi:hypothetical protein